MEVICEFERECRCQELRLKEEGWRIRMKIRPSEYLGLGRMREERALAYSFLEIILGLSEYESEEIMGSMEVR